MLLPWHIDTLTYWYCHVVLCAWYQIAVALEAGLPEKWWILDVSQLICTHDINSSRYIYMEENLYHVPIDDDSGSWLECHCITHTPTTLVLHCIERKKQKDKTLTTTWYVNWGHIWFNASALKHIQRLTAAQPLDGWGPTGFYSHREVWKGSIIPMSQELDKCFLLSGAGASYQ